MKEHLFDMMDHLPKRMFQPVCGKAAGFIQFFPVFFLPFGHPALSFQGNMIEEIQELRFCSYQDMDVVRKILAFDK